MMCGSEPDVRQLHVVAHLKSGGIGSDSGVDCRLGAHNPRAQVAEYFKELSLLLRREGVCGVVEKQNDTLATSLETDLFK